MVNFRGCFDNSQEDPLLGEVCYHSRLLLFTCACVCVCVCMCACVSMCAVCVYVYKFLQLCNSNYTVVTVVNT